MPRPVPLRHQEGQRPPQDPDGDYVLALGDVHAIVAPRAITGGPLVVRVFSITNTGVKVVPELGLFLARLNFGLTFGRFALDTEHDAIWFDETLVGDQFTDDDLRFTIRVVASTADEPIGSHSAADFRDLQRQNQSLADSNAGLAVDLRNEIRSRMLQGESDAQIVAFLVERYGERERLYEVG